MRYIGYCVEQAKIKKKFKYFCLLNSAHSSLVYPVTTITPYDAKAI